jgi:hypothetical protein
MRVEANHYKSTALPLEGRAGCANAFHCPCEPAFALFGPATT